MTRPPLVVLTTLLSLAASVTASNDCFWPSGKTTDLVPCNVSSTDTGVRHCCSGTDICLSNRLCFSTAVGVLYRGACTDPSWGPPCIKLFGTTNADSFANLVSCQNGEFRNVAGNCSDKDVYTYTTAQQLSLASATSAATSSTASATGTSLSGLSSPTSSAPSPAISTSCADLSTARRTVGLGVGLGLGLPLLAAVAALVWLWRKQRRPPPEGAAPPSWELKDRPDVEVGSSPVLGPRSPQPPPLVEMPSRRASKGPTELAAPS